ncbi:MAG: hypothetical protein ACTSR2_15280 [Candidatus Hodarchaeales archaeon]
MNELVTYLGGIAKSTWMPDENIYWVAVDEERLDKAKEILKTLKELNLVKDYKIERKFRV